MADAVKLEAEEGIFQKLKSMSWGLVALIIMLACVGFVALYSAAGGNVDPWASRQAVRFSVGLFIMLVLACVDMKWWYRLAYPFYFVCLFLLLVVEVFGHIGMGAQRWINLGFMQLQPSELMKLAIVLVLARYFHTAAAEDMRSLRFLLIPIIMIVAPVALVMFQPDLGTSLMITMVGVALIFLAGAPIKWFLIAGALVVVSVPIAWTVLHDYQKQRVITFLNPEEDPLGSGYHIIQSKIALGSGGIDGKGFLKGTQSHLNFLPEKQTDFIFTLWAEEWGLLGGLFLLTLLGLIFSYGALIALRCRHSFGRLLAFGLTFNFSVYVFVNVAMVMGLIPVVGAPLPLVSYGGTAMLSVLIGFGLVLSCHVHRDAKLPRS